MIDCSKTINYLLERNRMCDFHGGCEECPLYNVTDKKNMFDNCDMIEKKFPDKAITIVQEWSDEHPKKTYLSELLKYFPNIELDKYGAPRWICPHHLGLHDIEGCKKNCTCIECWNQPIEDGEE